MSRKAQLFIMTVILIIAITISCLWFDTVKAPKPINKPSFGGCTCSSEQVEEIYAI